MQMSLSACWTRKDGCGKKNREVRDRVLVCLGSLESPGLPIVHTGKANSFRHSLFLSQNLFPQEGYLREKK